MLFRRYRWLLPCLLLLAGAAQTAEFVWIEAETPAQANFTFAVDSRRPELYSAGKCFFHAVAKDALGKLPAEGLLLRYDFSAKTAGSYRFWTRLGMEWVRAPMDWRLDDGPWQTYAATELTTNLMQVAVWNELAWANCGNVTLAPGPHRLEIRFQKPNKDQLLFALDALAFTDPAWIPEGCLKPGESYSAPADQAAAAKTYAPEPPGPAATPGARTVLPLSGPWQVARWDDPNMDAEPLAPVKALPADYPFRWMGLNVPGNAWTGRPELAFAHRLVYQTRIDVPAGLAGRSFVLHFAGTCYIASVFVNGQFCDSRQSVLVPWDCDLTKLIKPGQANLLQIAVKGGYYCIDMGGKGSLHERRNTPEGFLKHVKFTDAVYPSSKGEGDGLDVGLVNPCELRVSGPAYSADVYVRTTVAKRRLDATVEVNNPQARPAALTVQCEAVADTGGQVEKRFPAQSLQVPAGGSAKVEIGDAWTDAKLWWPAEKMGDLPTVYRLRTTLLADDRPIDVREDTFGFRDIVIQGRNFLLNGVPWRFYNWVDIPGRQAFTDHQEWLRRYHAQNDSFHRFSWDHSRFFGYREQAIECLDRYGIPSRCSTSIDGMFITQDMLNPVLWQNWENHLRQVVRAYRNHPAIVHWSIGNEVMLINAHNTKRGQTYLELEKRMAGLIALVKELDPTRDAYEDGAGDLGGADPVDCVHYTWSWYPEVPRRLYDYVTGRPAKRPGAWRDTMMWNGDRPRLGGEEFYYTGQASQIAWFGGPEVYRGRAQADLAAGRYARMALEGARWQDCAGMCPWTNVLPGAAEKAMARRAVFVREYNQCFVPGSELLRTVKVFNDSRHPGKLTLRWQLVFGSDVAAKGEKTYDLAPGINREDRLSIRLPQAAERRDGNLQLRLFAGADLVFEDSRPIALLPLANKVPAPPAGTLAVCDPQGKVLAWLGAHGLKAAAVQTPAELPAGAASILLGEGALTPANKKEWAAALKAAVQAGKTVIVLQQDTPLAGDELAVPGIAVATPADKRVIMSEFAKMGGHSGAICHPNALAHPVFAGLKPGDFCTWADGETNYRLSYATPAGGAVSLVQAGEELAHSPMLELPVGGGSCLLSQLLIESKLGVEPVADRLLSNLLAWAQARTENQPLPAVVCSSGNPDLPAFLGSLGLSARTVATPAEAFATPPAQASVIVLPGTAANLAWLQSHRQDLDRFCQAGRWVMLAGLDREALPALNALVGVEQRSRPFGREAVRLEDPAEPLMLGVTDRDFSQRGYEVIAPWMNLYKVSGQIFSLVLDTAPDIAAFAEKAPERLTDGMTAKEFWHYVQYFPSDLSEPVVFSYARPETFTRLEVWTSGAYHWPRELRLITDGDEAHALSFALKAEADRQVFDFAPRQAKQVMLKVTSLHESSSTKPLYTLDEVRLIRQIPPATAAKALALTSPAGIVKYPLGKGGLILNCLQTQEEQQKPATARASREFDEIQRDNLRKKQAIVSALLRNLGAAFGAPKSANESYY